MNLKSLYLGCGNINNPTQWKSVQGSASFGFIPRQAIITYSPAQRWWFSVFTWRSSIGRPNKATSTSRPRKSSTPPASPTPRIFNPINKAIMPMPARRGNHGPRLTTCSRYCPKVKEYTTFVSTYPTMSTQQRLPANPTALISRRKVKAPPPSP